MEEVFIIKNNFIIGVNNQNNQILINENRKLKVELNKKNKEIEDCKIKLNILQGELNRLINNKMKYKKKDNYHNQRGKSTNNIRVTNRNDFNFANPFNFDFMNLQSDDFNFGGNIINNVHRINPNFNPGDYEDFYDDNINMILKNNGRGYNDNNEELEQEVIDQLCPDPDKMTYEQLLELEENVGKVSKGLSKNQIKKLNHGKYSKTRFKSTDNKCVVCQYDFTEGDNITELSCGHVFHSDCVDTWLTKNKTCPLCQKEITIR